ncbi:unnamed protein product [Oreochromis niloticus]|nr:unnamed protein product [Mustela putorius furo]
MSMDYPAAAHEEASVDSWKSTITKELTRVNERVKGSDHLKPLKPPEDEGVQLVAVAVALICICIQQSSATFAEIRELQELQEAVNNDGPAAEHQEVSADSWLVCLIQ